MQMWVGQFGRARQAGVSFLGLPPWAKVILMIFALPGLILLALSMLAFIVSLLALLLLTLPVYSLLRTIIGGPKAKDENTGVRKVEATIIE